MQLNEKMLSIKPFRCLNGVKKPNSRVRIKYLPHNNIEQLWFCCSRLLAFRFRKSELFASKFTDSLKFVEKRKENQKTHEHSRISVVQL